MARRKTDRQKGESRAPAESRAADALTIGWLMSVLMGSVCQLGVLAARWWFSGHPADQWVGVLGKVLLFAAAVVGLVALVLTPIVYRVRRVKPPTSVIGYALAIGGVPIAILIAQMLK